MQTRKSTRRRTRSAKRQKIASLCVLGAVAAAALAVCFLLLAPMFNIKNIVVTGNSKISSETIIEGSQLKTDENIFLTWLPSYEKKVEGLDYIEDCNISRILPDTLEIAVTERQPAAYFSIGDILAVTDMNGVVVSLVNAADTAEITALKRPAEEEEAAPTGSPSPDGESVDEESTADGTIWGYDDDGDPIYRVNGGHYEFDEDGNRYFVDDTPSASPEPTSTPEPGDSLSRTSFGTIIYDAPIVRGVGISEYKEGREIKSDDSEKLSSVFESLRALNSAGLLSRTTEFNAENVNDIRFTVENRLDVWFGTFMDFEYKARFVASVIDNYLSSYEHAVLDFRDSRLYVRSDSAVPPMPEPSTSPSPSEDPDSQEAETEPSRSPNPSASPGRSTRSNATETDEPEPTESPEPNDSDE